MNAFALVVMGVAGAGKSTLGRALADQLGCPFVEGDDLHPPANIAKMASGMALDDEDRVPFLDNVAAAIARHAGGEVGAVAVVSCSALRHSYRDRIRAAAGVEVCFVLPQLSPAQLEARMAARQGHFMPPSLLASQLATLELPGANEWAITLPGDQPLPDLVAAVCAATGHGAIGG